MNYKILKDGEVVNTIVSDADFVEKYCKTNDYTYELIPMPEPEQESAPSQLDIIEAQVTYTAMMTNTLLEV